MRQYTNMLKIYQINMIILDLNVILKFYIIYIIKLKVYIQKDLLTLI